MTLVSSLSTHELVAKVGETDQQFLTQPTPMLAKLRSQLRIQLSKLSHQKQEQLYFLTEAVTLLELALLNVTSMDEHLELSAALGESYIEFYHATKEQRYLVISTQVIKTLSQHDHPLILLALARLSAAQQHESLVKHWLTRLLRIEDADINAIKQTDELKPYHHQIWFKQLLQTKIH